MDNNLVLEQFKNLQINLQDLTKHLGKGIILMQSDAPPIFIDTADVKRLIEFYLAGKISFQDVIDWCDIIRFSELFSYPEDEDAQEAVAVVIDEMQDYEDFDKGTVFSLDDISKWLKMLDAVS